MIWIPSVAGSGYGIRRRTQVRTVVVACQQVYGLGACAFKVLLGDAGVEARFGAGDAGVDDAREASAAELAERRPGGVHLSIALGRRRLGGGEASKEQGEDGSAAGLHFCWIAERML